MNSSPNRPSQSKVSWLCSASSRRSARFHAARAGLRAARGLRSAPAAYPGCRPSTGAACSLPSESLPTRTSCRRRGRPFPERGPFDRASPPRWRQRDLLRRHRRPARRRLRRQPLLAPIQRRSAGTERLQSPRRVSGGLRPVVPGGFRPAPSGRHRVNKSHMLQGSYSDVITAGRPRVYRLGPGSRRGLAACGKVAGHNVTEAHGEWCRARMLFYNGGRRTRCPAPISGRPARAPRRRRFTGGSGWPRPA